MVKNHQPVRMDGDPKDAKNSGFGAPFLFDDSWLLSSYQALMKLRLPLLLPSSSATGFELWFDSLSLPVSEKTCWAAGKCS